MSEGYEVDIGIIGHILEEGHFTLVAFRINPWMLAFIMPGSLGPAILPGKVDIALPGGGGGISACVLWGVISW